MDDLIQCITTNILQFDMSFIGRTPIPVPSGTTVALDGNSLTLKGPLGELSHPIPEGIQVCISSESSTVTVQPKSTSYPKSVKALWGTTQSILENKIGDISNGFVVDLQLVGVGYRASVEGDTLVMKLGYSHDIRMKVPQSVEATTPQANRILLRGPDRQVVTSFAANIRRHRFPEPYKGKGILFQGEVIRRKEGKKK